MIGYLTLIISLYKLVTDGLKSVSDILKAERKRDVQRRIIQIQLSPEDIIDNANKILSIIKLNADKKKLGRQEADVLRSLAYSQSRSLDSLLDHLRDDTSEEIMKLFGPDIRRRIFDLIHIKRGAIEHLIYATSRLDRTRFRYANPEMYEWSHDRFLAEGDRYVRETLWRPKKKRISIFERIPEQERIVSELAECSKQLSDLIRSQMNIEDVIFARDKKDRNGA